MPFGAAAQSSGTSTKIEFLDEDFCPLPSTDGAVYRRETAQTDRQAGVVHDYFLSGKPAQTITYDNLRKHTATGVAERWYENGQLRLHREYAKDHSTSELRTYYASGQLKRREHYDYGKRTTGECFSPDGAPVAFYEFDVLPVYSEGAGAVGDIVGAVQRSFRYPVEALRTHTTGRVLVAFKVTKTGEVTDIHIEQPLSAVVDAEAIRSVQQLGHFTPGRQDGEPVGVRFTVPLTLAIR